jgi:hypothetical protein
MATERGYPDPDYISRLEEHLDQNWNPNGLYLFAKEQLGFPWSADANGCSNFCVCLWSTLTKQKPVGYFPTKYSIFIFNQTGAIRLKIATYYKYNHKSNLLTYQYQTKLGILLIFY